MKRRTMVKASLMAGSFAGIASAAKALENNQMEKKPETEYYELRVYTLKNAMQQKLVEDYFKNALLPALNKAGSKNIGVFTEQQPEGQTKLFALIPYNSVADFINSTDKLSNDNNYMQTASAYLNAPATEPAYERIQSSFMKAFEGMPKLIAPGKKPRIFELRRYESSGEGAAKKKIKMFNDLGEMAIFKRVGLTPVFFGETLIGEMRPNLTYMITFANMEEHDEKWKTFGSDPEWNKVKSIPGYADPEIVSHITRTFLVPTDFSQI